eukprot:CAMPEP_0181185106 /NCGR_PEP_ID=MMETSP1096-20121128/9327_1 /TAXON_ID=156174 ORGANISM="Chrysochromulina ericina, Strain CCMP281" /NCGR_SAMPLE_ID=MMETSP1096 /ASSEMBLY_ACC=CAM_ASM_000453 /LENGTH=346 /DNA_ID=CAMNT_0023273921 /DNA_START=1 /DNA_END=1041 /DNA_ORIENTATION=+
MTDTVDKHVSRKYDIGRVLGKGAYGIVWHSVDKKTKQVVAVKKIFDAFQNPTDAQRTFREVVFLKQLSHHDNVVTLFDVFRADNDKDIYLVFEYLETDLHAVIRAGILTEVHQKFIMYQCCNALSYMHSANLIHRDLKPANILMNAECLVKIADFGLARSLEGGQTNVLTDYIATRWYRAPEILLGSTKYGKAVDMWSLGIIFGEILGGKPIFAGTSTLSQLEKICSVVGMPTDEEVEATQSQFARTMVDNLKVDGKPKGWRHMYPDAKEAEIDMLKQLLLFHPDKRLTAPEGMQHEYCSVFHVARPEAEQTPLAEPVSIDISDNEKKSTSFYREKLYVAIEGSRA